MFTGLIECTGVVKQVRPRDKALTLIIEPNHESYDVMLGDSVAIDGVCLTVEERAGSAIVFTAVRETLSATALMGVGPGRVVNLERAVALGGRMGGHLVLGHVDGVGRIVDDRKDGAALVRTIRVPADLRKFMASKGSVTVDGVSLTIAEGLDDGFRVWIIPHTAKATNLLSKRAGEDVNIECDVVARYIFHLLKSGAVGDSQPDDNEKNGGSDLLSRMEALGF